MFIAKSSQVTMFLLLNDAICKEEICMTRAKDVCWGVWRSRVEG
jgi:hypothetical protein